MTKKSKDFNGMAADEAVAIVMNVDITELLERAEVVRERRPAKMVTALRIDLGVQAELEASPLLGGSGRPH